MDRPIRRTLVLSPAALLAAGFAADLLGRWSDTEALWVAGAYLATAAVALGLLAGLPAGIAGARGVRGRRTRFAVVYGVGLALGALATWVRGNAAIPPEGVLIAAKGMAVALVLGGALAGGYLGGRRAAE